MKKFTGLRFKSSAKLFHLPLIQSVIEKQQKIVLAISLWSKLV
jgi:hypothetical protein